MLRRLLAFAASFGAFSAPTVAGADDMAGSGLPVVAADSQATPVSEPEAQPHPNDERWSNKPISVALSTILGVPQGGNPFLLPAVEVGGALPYVSVAATFGYLEGINASVAARLRLHLGHAVALTLGGRGVMLPFRACRFNSNEGCAENRQWTRAFFAGGEVGVEGRSQAGFMWRAQAGVWGLVGHGHGTCTAADPTRTCVPMSPQPGVVATQELTVGWAF